MQKWSDRPWSRLIPARGISRALAPTEAITDFRRVRCSSPYLYKTEHRLKDARGDTSISIQPLRVSCSRLTWNLADIRTEASPPIWAIVGKIDPQFYRRMEWTSFYFHLSSVARRFPENGWIESCLARSVSHPIGLTRTGERRYRISISICRIKRRTDYVSSS